MIRMLTCWLVFVLLVVCFIFVPQLLHAQQKPYVVCDGGICAMSEATLEALISLAKKAGKDCT